MPTVTSLEKIKRLKGWFELVLDKSVSFPVNDELILKYLIGKGKQYLPHEIREIREQGEYLYLKKKALDALGRRRLSERELRDKLKPVPKSSQHIDKLIDDLKRLGLVDDTAYANALIHSHQVTGKKSKRYIKNKLYQKGVPKELAEKAIDRELEEYDEAQIALQLAEKKYKTIRELPVLKAKKRIADFLAGRGFGWDDINYALDRVFGERE